MIGGRGGGAIDDEETGALRGGDGMDDSEARVEREGGSVGWSSKMWRSSTFSKSKSRPIRSLTSSVGSKPNGVSLYHSARRIRRTTSTLVDNPPRRIPPNRNPPQPQPRPLDTLRIRPPNRPSQLLTHHPRLESLDERKSSFPLTNTSQFRRFSRHARIRIVECRSVLEDGGGAAGVGTGGRDVFWGIAVEAFSSW